MMFLMQRAKYLSCCGLQLLSKQPLHCLQKGDCERGPGESAFSQIYPICMWKRMEIIGEALQLYRSTWDLQQGIGFAEPYIFGTFIF